MRLALLKRRDGGDSALLEAFQSVIDNMTLSEAEITEILRELRTLTQQQGLVTSVLLHSVRRCVESDGEGRTQTIERLLLFLIFHCAKDEDHSKAMKDLGTAFSCVKSGDCGLSKVSITACLTVRLSVEMDPH